MSYRFECDDDTVQDGLRRIATDQIDKAIGECHDDTLDEHQTVHKVRKRCKKLRGLIRLVRPGFDEYATENAHYRDAAHTLSILRDTEATIESYDALLSTYDEQIERRALASIRRRLTLRQKEAVHNRDLQAKLAAFAERMVDGRDRAQDWELDAEGFDALAGGLANTFKRARKSMAGARSSPSPQSFHEWRKRIKYHWYHARLLQLIWSEPMAAHCDAADYLSDLLGSHHDLAVLRQRVSDDPRAYGEVADVEVLVGLIDRRQAGLAAEAFQLGDRLLAERPSALTRRWHAYWIAWRGDRSACRAAITA
jgi:CHAD domain-containing protein